MVEHDGGKVEHDGGKVEQVPQFTIRDPETVRLIREATQCEGKLMTAVVAEAVEENFDRDSKPTVNEERMQYVLGLGRQGREHMERVNPEWLGRDPIADLYDEETGLPK